jgi:two-component system OmpR family response regulator
MGNVNRVLSRSMIEERVWGYQEDPMTNVVDVYIRRLRRKMDEGFDNPLIHTVRGVGYQLKAPR